MNGLQAAYLLLIGTFLALGGALVAFSLFPLFYPGLAGGFILWSVSAYACLQNGKKSQEANP